MLSEKATALAPAFHSHQPINAAGFANPAARFNTGPPPGPAAAAPLAAPRPASLAPAGPKAGYGSGYANQFARPAAAAYPQQQSSQLAQPRSGPRPSQGFNHQGGGSGSQGPRSGPGTQHSQVADASLRMLQS